MITKSKDELMARLKPAGFTFSQFELVSEGRWETYDADWNYKDIPHLNALHKLVNSYPSSIDDQIVTSVNLQAVAGVVLPMIVVNYHSGPNRQTYYTSFLNLLLIVETTWSSLGPNHTRVVTQYAIGSRWYLKFLHPIVRRLITKNYRQLMSEDLPMRERRGNLRDWGYAFRTDGPVHSFAATLHILEENMVVRREMTPPAPQRVTVAEIETARAQDIFTTRSDHWGLRLNVRDGALHVYPRMCPHEGACLDEQPLDRGTVKCPWHGRLLRPLASIPYPFAPDAAPVELRYHTLKPGAAGLEIVFKDTPLATQAEPTEQAPALTI
jgi:Rieske [2Fe-2S] domain